MAISQNGWPTPPPLTRKWIIPGTDRHLVLRDGSAGFLLIHLALWFHERIERLNEGVWDEWGGANRPIRGSKVTSNHASYTAADLNATLHPLGVATASTFTPRQTNMIRRRVKVFFLGLIRWGGDYQNRPDAMHFEINGPLHACERLARALMKTPRGRRILAANPGAREVILS